MNHIIIFIKNPELGKVKTRLAKDVGDEAALNIYFSLTKSTRENVLEVEAKRHLYYSHFIDSNDDWKSADFDKKLQSGNDLGQKMKAAFSEVFEEEKSVKKSVVIIGSDCPELEATTLNLAFEGLNHSDAVIGPTCDGGYYLIGMNTFMPQLFDEISWSTEVVFEQTMKHFKSLGLSYSILPKLNDIDHIEDWERELERKKN